MNNPLAPNTPPVDDQMINGGTDQHAQNPHVINVTTDTFESEVVNASHERFILVDFWASWCQPCMTLKPTLEKLAAEYNGAFTLALVNADEEQMLAQQIGVRSLPTVILIQDGGLVDQFMGALPESELRGFLDKHVTALPAEDVQDPSQDADALFIAADYPAAAMAYQKILENDEKNIDALLGLADCYLQMGESEAANNILTQLDSEHQNHERAMAIRAKLSYAEKLVDAPDTATLEARVNNNTNDLEARHLLGMRYLLADQAEAALEQFLAIMKQDVHLEDGIGKPALLSALNIIQDPALVSTYRQKMTQLMFV